MKLLEFFGKTVKTDADRLGRKDDQNVADEVFWHILDHDKLHKEYFFPLAKKIKKSHGSPDESREKCVAEFMPMVEKGCKEFYIKNRMTGKLSKLFPKDLREELCDRLYDHYHDDIIKDSYKLE